MSQRQPPNHERQRRQRGGQTGGRERAVPEGRPAAVTPDSRDRQGHHGHHGHQTLHGRQNQSGSRSPADQHHDHHRQRGYHHRQAQGRQAGSPGGHQSRPQSGAGESGFAAGPSGSDAAQEYGSTQHHAEHVTGHWTGADRRRGGESRTYGNPRLGSQRGEHSQQGPSGRVGSHFGDLHADADDQPAGIHDYRTGRERDRQYGSRRGNSAQSPDRTRRR